MFDKICKGCTQPFQSEQPATRYCDTCREAKAAEEIKEPVFNVTFEQLQHVLHLWHFLKHLISHLMCKR